jgi:hypothetical protein
MQTLTMSGTPDHNLASAVEHNKRVLLQNNPKLSPLEAHRQAMKLATQHNPTLLSSYRAYGKGSR